MGCWRSAARRSVCLRRPVCGPGGRADKRGLPWPPRRARPRGLGGAVALGSTPTRRHVLRRRPRDAGLLRVVVQHIAAGRLLGVDRPGEGRVRHASRTTATRAGSVPRTHRGKTTPLPVAVAERCPSSVHPAKCKQPGKRGGMTGCNIRTGSGVKDSPQGPSAGLAREVGVAARKPGGSAVSWLAATTWR